MWICVNLTYYYSSNKHWNILLDYLLDQIVLGKILQVLRLNDNVFNSIIFWLLRNLVVELNSEQLYLVYTPQLHELIVNRNFTPNTNALIQMNGFLNNLIVVKKGIPISNEQVY